MIIKDLIIFFLFFFLSYHHYYDYSIMMIKRCTLFSQQRKVQSIIPSWLSFKPAVAFNHARTDAHQSSKHRTIVHDVKNVINSKKIKGQYDTYHHPFIIQTKLHFSNGAKSDKDTTSLDNKSKNNNDRVLIKDLGNGIFNVQLNRPHKCNALDMQMFESIGETLSYLQRDHKNLNMRCIILSGNGKAFCTGLDVPSIIKPGNSDGSTSTEMTSMMMPHTKMNRLLERPSGYDLRHESVTKSSNDESKGIGNLAQDVAFLWRSIPVPVIAVLHGMCFGGGMQIALGADIRIVTPTCKLSIMEAKWGLIPDMSASITLRELIPIDIAKELTFTGRIINGVEAKEIGLVTKCVTNSADNTNEENDFAMKEALILANEIVKQSPDAIAAAKMMYQKTRVDTNEEQCLILESKLQKQLIPSWNQFVASAKNFGVSFSYTKTKDLE